MKNRWTLLIGLIFTLIGCSSSEPEPELDPVIGLSELETTENAKLGFTLSEDSLSKLSFMSKLNLQIGSITSEHLINPNDLEVSEIKEITLKEKDLSSSNTKDSEDEYRPTTDLWAYEIKLKGRTIFIAFKQLRKQHWEAPDSPGIFISFKNELKENRDKTDDLIKTSKLNNQWLLLQYKPPYSAEIRGGKIIKTFGDDAFNWLESFGIDGFLKSSPFNLAMTPTDINGTLLSRPNKIKECISYMTPEKSITWPAITQLKPLDLVELMFSKFHIRNRYEISIDHPRSQLEQGNFQLSRGGTQSIADKLIQRIPLTDLPSTIEFELMLIKKPSYEVVSTSYPTLKLANGFWDLSTWTLKQSFESNFSGTQVHETHIIAEDPKESVTVPILFERNCILDNPNTATK